MNSNYVFSIGVILSLCLLALSFFFQPIDFWLLFPMSLFLLSIYSWVFEKPSFQRMTGLQWLLALVSGIVLYVVFAVGKWLIVTTSLPLINQLELLYQLVKPTELIHYMWLFLVIIPGEEWFWRGFIVKRLSERTTLYRAAIIGTCLYAGVHLVTGSLLLVMAAFTAGLIWSLIYLKTRNIVIAIVSHIIFDSFLLVLFPLF